jgi:SAM-dependent methyltransferase
MIAAAGTDIVVSEQWSAVSTLSSEPHRWKSTDSPDPMTANPTEQVRADYDRIAGEYARRMFHELDAKPKDRELLLRFASNIGNSGEVCDMGCGPGHVARFLRDNGVRSVYGLDLSPAMLDHARRLNPDIEFREGNLLSLPLADGSLAGISAFYAIVYIPEASLPAVFGEMFRVLQPGGLVLLAFHIGGEVLRPEELFGQQIATEFYHFERAPIETLLASGGFHIEEVVERGPYAPEVEYQSRRAYILARKPRVP